MLTALSACALASEARFFLNNPNIPVHPKTMTYGRYSQRYTHSFRPGSQLAFYRPAGIDSNLVVKVDDVCSAHLKEGIGTDFYWPSDETFGKSVITFTTNATSPIFCHFTVSGSTLHSPHLVVGGSEFTDTFGWLRSHWKRQVQGYAYSVIGVSMWNKTHYHFGISFVFGVIALLPTLSRRNRLRAFASASLAATITSRLLQGFFGKFGYGQAYGLLDALVLVTLQLPGRWTTVAAVLSVISPSRWWVDTILVVLYAGI